MFENQEKQMCDLECENSILQGYVKHLEEQIDDLRKEQIISSEEVCKMFGVEISTLGRYKREKHLPYHKFGRTSPVYYIKQEVEEWAKKNFKIK